MRPSTNSFEGTCPHCGTHFYGQALNRQRNQLCVKCGSALEIKKNGFRTQSEIYPFGVVEYDLAPEKDNWQDLEKKNLLFYLTMN